MSFLLAITFLTVIPIRRRAQSDHSALGRAMLWFPVVGLLIGVVTCGVLLVAAQVLPGMLPEIVAVVFVVGLTGALHLDGLADTFDGLFGGRDRASRLAIMRRPGIGAYGVAAVVCVLLLKVGALAGLAEGRWLSQLPALERRGWLTEAFGGRWVQVVVVALMPVWGRWVMTLAAGIGPYARAEGGTGALFVEGMSVVEACVLGLIPLGVTGFLLGWPGLVAGGLAALATLLLLVWWRGKLGGVTGDCLGALGEVIEVAFALMALMLLPAGRAGPPY